MGEDSRKGRLIRSQEKIKSKAVSRRAAEVAEKETLPRFNFQRKK